MNPFIGSQIKAVLFDHDDTLVGTITAKWAQHKHIAQNFYNKQVTDDRLRQHWGKPLAELVSLLYETTDIEQAMANILATRDQYPKELFPATLPALRRLHKSGKLIGIITATSRVSFEHDLSSHNFPRECISYTQTADDTSFHKPDPRVFEPTLAWLADKNIQPNEVIYIGDGLHDMKAAIGAGFHFLGVQTGLVTANEFAAAQIASIPSLADLL